MFLLSWGIFNEKNPYLEFCICMAHPNSTVTPTNPLDFNNPSNCPSTSFQTVQIQKLQNLSWKTFKISYIEVLPCYQDKTIYQKVIQDPSNLGNIDEERNDPFQKNNLTNTEQSKITSWGWAVPSSDPAKLTILDMSSYN